jgi:hypothetical protein
MTWEQLPALTEETAWKVWRHSGRGGGPEQTASWRLVGWFYTEHQARNRYDIIRNELRQGGVKLIQPDGKTVGEYHAPRIRSRW